MQCENCGIDVDERFKAAIKKNKCPACDGEIMPAEKLVSLINLKNLLNSNFNNIDVEQIATLVVANFELKQIFKSELPKTKEIVVKVEETLEEDEVDNDEDAKVNEDKQSDEEYKKQQLSESRKILQKMRDEALDEAMADQWGLGNANVFADGDNIREIVNNEKRTISRENVLTGADGAFRRQ